MPRTAVDRTRRANYTYLGQTLRSLESDLALGLAGSDRIPDAWHSIALEDPVPGKQKLTLRLDQDVVKFFRATGAGYLTRINAVLRAYMQARLAGVVQGPEAAATGLGIWEEAQAEMEAYQRDLPELERRIKQGPAPEAALKEMDRRMASLQRKLESMLG